MGDVHVIPSDDIIQHEETSDCICSPHILPVADENGSYNWVVTHNAWDGRK